MRTGSQTKNKARKGSSLPCGRPRNEDSVKKVDSEETIDFLVAKFERFCETEGLWTSSARRKIVSLIAKSFKHFTLQELVVEMAKRYPEVGRATLYRTIPFLVRAGILQEGPKGTEGASFYELAETRHHDHIFCLDCEEIFEFESEKIEEEQEKILGEMRFRPARHSHVIYAHCARLERQK